MRAVFSILVGMGTFLIWLAIVFSVGALFGKFLAIGFGITLAFGGVLGVAYILGGGTKGERERARQKRLARLDSTDTSQSTAMIEGDEEIVRKTIEAVYEHGASWIPKTRSSREYLREIEQRWRARGEANRMPIRLSDAVLEVVHDDCVGHPGVLSAIERAKNADLPKTEIQFQ